MKRNSNHSFSTETGPLSHELQCFLVSKVSKSPIAWDIFRIPNKLVCRTKKEHVANIASSGNYRVIPVFGRG